MIRNIETNTHKAVSVMYTAKEEMTRGAFVTLNETDMTVSKATGDTIYLVDVPKTYDGINSIVEPTDADFEKIAKDQRVIVIPVQPGERYATSEVTKGEMNPGDKMDISGGKAATGTGAWIYCGEYTDPTGIPMYIVRRDIVAGA